MALGAEVAVPPLVGGDHVEPGCGHRLHLMAPAVSQFGEPVAEHDDRVAHLAGFMNHEVDAVDSDGGATGFGHGCIVAHAAVPFRTGRLLRC